MGDIDFSGSTYQNNSSDQNLSGEFNTSGDFDYVTAGNNVADTTVDSILSGSSNISEGQGDINISGTESGLTTAIVYNNTYSTSVTEVINYGGTNIYGGTNTYSTSISTGNLFNIVEGTNVTLNTSGTNITINASNIDFFNFNTAYTPIFTPTTGYMAWNSDEETLDIVTGTSTTLQVGQESVVNVKNQTGALISNGTPVMFAGTLGNSGRVLIQKAIADGSLDSSYTVGVTTEDIADGDNGKVTWFGKVRNLDTTGTPYGEVWSDGDILYISADTEGYLTKTAPQAPNRAIQVAAVIHAHSNGTLLVRPSWHPKFTDLDDVNGTPLTTSGQIPVWDQANQYFDFTRNINEIGTKADQFGLIAGDNISIGTDVSNFTINYTGPTSGGSTFGLTAGTGTTLGTSGDVITVSSTSKVLISEQTVSVAVASIDFLSGFSSTYKSYILELENLTPVTNDVNLYIRLSNDGSTFISSAGAYSWGVVGNISATAQTRAANSAIAIVTSFAGATTDIANTSNGGVHLSYTIFGLDDSSQYTAMLGQSCWGASGGNQNNAQGQGRRLATEINNGIQILFSSGNIASGKARLYGVY
jgi:hypothetical protein